MEETIYTTKEINAYIRKLKKKQINFWDIPDVLWLNKSIVDIERKLGIRKSDKKGYDIIHNFFFVEEIITNISSNKSISQKHRTTFPDFNSYYLFLDGNIYENSCYYQFDFSTVKENIDLDKISFEAFEKRTIDDYVYEPSKEEIESYNQAELTKKLCKKCLKKINECTTYEEFCENIVNYKKSGISKVKIYFFLFQYLFNDVNDKNRFNIVMKYIMHNYYQILSLNMINSLCLIYNPEDVLSAYNDPTWSKSTKYKKKANLKFFIKSLNDKNTVLKTRCFFDTITHYYCEEVCYNGLGGSAKTLRYFETFESFIAYRHGDLRNCDISNAMGLDFDFSKCKTDSTTKLPFKSSNKLTYTLTKKYKNGNFYVNQHWVDANQNIIKQYEHTFLYFFDFVAFLKGDLSGANLLFCDGLKNLKDITKLNLSDALLTSKISKQFGIKFDKYHLNTYLIHSFPLITKNEKETAVILQSNHETKLSTEEIFINQKISYITDLHLLHRIQHANCKSQNDIIYLLDNIVKNIIDNASNLLLIGGDTASDFSIFELFVKILSENLNRTNNLKVIFLLGNHELWEFPGEKLSDIVNKYKLLLQKYNMYLLQNDILYKDRDSDGSLKRITTEEILSCDKPTLRNKLQTSSIIIFGGLAFSGYNEEYNANDGIYRFTIDRKNEIKETQKFEKIYNKICETLPDKNLIVFSHTPKKDWCKNPGNTMPFIYVSGHTHHNFWMENEENRIYADNQIGYHNENPHSKYFYMTNTYDFFSDYIDGIYKITATQYEYFYYGKMRKSINLTREINTLYMLKKNGYYCFIHESKNGGLTILNGAALKKLKYNNIQYYYDNMDKVISHIKKPLDVFTKIQNQISSEIKKIGGDGTVHGCIIDIDFYNHIYVNPMDMKITGYYALNMIHKKIYSNIVNLLKEQCSELYEQYEKMIKDNSANPIIIQTNAAKDLSEMPTLYLDTDIYNVSREICKMQKLYSNILTLWLDLPTNEMMLDTNSKPLLKTTDCK